MTDRRHGMTIIKIICLYIYYCYPNDPSHLFPLIKSLTILFFTPQQQNTHTNAQNKQTPILKKLKNKLKHHSPPDLWSTPRSYRIHSTLRQNVVQPWKTNSFLLDLYTLFRIFLCIRCVYISESDEYSTFVDDGSVVSWWW